MFSHQIFSTIITTNWINKFFSGKIFHPGNKVCYEWAGNCDCIVTIVWFCCLLDTFPGCKKSLINYLTYWDFILLYCSILCVLHVSHKNTLIIVRKPLFIQNEIQSENCTWWTHLIFTSKSVTNTNHSIVIMY